MIRSVLQKRDECNKNGGLTDCLRTFLISCSALFKSNTLHFIVILSPILALERADLKNNNGFQFEIPKIIETDVNFPTKNIQFYPFWSFILHPDETDM